MNNLVEKLYREYKENWNYVEPFYEDSKRLVYGKLINNDITKQFIEKKLNQSIFKKFLDDDFLIDCVVHLKSEPTYPTTFVIKKSKLLDSFIEKLYNSYGNDWKRFDTYFNDTKQLVYGSIKNNSYRKKHRYLTFSGLRIRRKAVNQYFFEIEKNDPVELFYCIYFKNSDFIKIGHIFQKFSFRLYNYIYPSSTTEIQKIRRIRS